MIVIMIVMMIVMTMLPWICKLTKSLRPGRVHTILNSFMIIRDRIDNDVDNVDGTFSRLLTKASTYLHPKNSYDSDDDNYDDVD